MPHRLRPSLAFLCLFLFLSIVASAQWQKVTGPPNDSPASGVGGESGNTLYGGFGNNGVYRSTDNGLSWAAVNTGLVDGAGGILPPTTLLRMADGRIIRGGVTASWNNRAGSAIWHSSDGSSWTEAPYPFSVASKNPSGALAFTKVAELDGTLFAAESLSHGVWKSTDQGATWAPSNTNLPSQFIGIASIEIIRDIAVANDTLFAVTAARGIWRSTDGGATWSDSNQTIPGTQDFLSNELIREGSSISVAPDDSIFVIVDGRVYKSTDYGDSWTLIGIGLFNGGIFGNARNVDTSGTHVYVITDTGNVLESADCGLSWEEIDTTTLPDEAIDILHRQGLRAHNNALYVALSSGLYRADLATATRLPVPPEILTADSQTLNANEGRDFTITIALNSATQPITWEWMKDDVVIPTANSETLNLANVDANDAGTYTVTATNAGGSDSISFTLVIHSAAAGNINYDFQPPALTGVGFFTSVRRIIALPDGRIWFGGQFSKVNDDERFYSAIVDASGDVDGSYDSSNRYPDDQIWAAARQRDGRFVIGYEDFIINGVPGNPFTDDYFTRIDADGDWDDSFSVFDDGATVFFLNDDVLSVAVAADGRIYAGGEFFRGGILRFFPDGTLDSTWPDGAISGNRQIDVIIPLPDGSVLVGGDFTSIRGVTSGSYRYLAKLKPNGALDTSFAVALPGRVLSAHHLPNGQVLVGGGSYLRRLNADGSTDDSFNTGQGGPSGNVNAIAVQRNGKIVIGGSLTAWNGDGSQRNLVRLNEDGTADSNFTPGQITTAITQITLHPSGDIFVNPSSNSLQRIIGDAVDLAITESPFDTAVNRGEEATFSVTTFSTSPVTYQWRKDGVPIAGATNATFSIAVTTDDDGGSYDVVVSNGSGSETSAPAVLTVLGDATITTQPEHQYMVDGGDITLSVVATGALPLSYQWKKDGTDIDGATAAILTISGAQASDAGVYTVMVSNVHNATTSVPAVVTLIPAPADELPGIALNPDSTIDDVACTADGKFYLVGTFSVIGGVNRPRIARLHADGTVDTVFVPDTAAFSVIHAVATATDGGVFFAGFNSSTFQRLVVKLNADGTLDNNFDAGIGVGGIGANANVTSLAQQPDGKILAGGLFTSVNNDASRQYIVRYNVDGTLDNDFTSGIPQGAPESIEVLPDGHILVAGGFFNVTGSSNQYIVRLRPDGTLDDGFDTENSQPANVVYATQRQADAKVIVGGTFLNVGGDSTHRYLTRYIPDGSVDPDYTPPLLSSTVRALDTHPEGMVFFAGQFSEIDGQIHGRVGALNQNGTLNNQFAANPGANHQVDHVCVSRTTGTVLVAGGFTHYNGQTRSRITVLNGFPVRLTITQQPAAAQIVNPGETPSLTIAASSLQPVAIQWQKDGADIAGATNATLNLSNATSDDTGVYRAVVTNVFGTIISEESSVIVRDAPIITEQPADQSLEEGSTPVTLSVAAVGVEPLTYQWQKDGNDIAGATDATLTLDPALVPQAGSYTVTVTNALGAATSAPATVDIFKTPTGIDFAYDLTMYPSNGTVTDVLLLTDGSLMVAGSFTATANGGANRYLTKYLPDGSEDPTFAIGTSLNGQVNKILAMPNGQFLIGGSFTSIGATSVSRLALLNGDGSLDLSFTGPAQLGAGGIFDIALQADGRIVVAGTFTTVDGTTTAGGVARLHADGTHDDTFDVGQGFMSGFNAPTVDAVEVLPDGRIIVGGLFTTFDQTTVNHLAMLNPDGSLDSSFVANSAPNNRVHDIDRTYDNKLLVAGRFTAFAGGTNRYLVKLDYQGNIDATFATTGLFTNYVQRARDTTDGAVVAAGVFTASGDLPNRIVTLDAHDARILSDFNYGSGFIGNAEALDVAPNGQIAVGGTFTSYRDNDTYQRVIVLNGRPVELAVLEAPRAQVVDSGTNVTFEVDIFTTSPASYQWQKNGTDLPGETAETLTITGVTPDDEGDYRVVVTNDSDSLASLSATLRVLAEPEFDVNPVASEFAFSGSGTLDATVVGAGDLTYQWYRNGVAIPGATMLPLTIDLVTSDTLGFYHLEASNAFGTTHSATITVTGTATPGAVDSSFMIGTGANSSVYTTLPLADGDVLVGGRYSSYNDQSRIAMVRLNDNGEFDETFDNSNGFAAGSQVWGFAESANGDIYAVGSFTSYGGTALSNVARITRNGTLDTTFVTPTFNTTINDIALQPDGKIIVGGSFNGGLRRLNTDGSLDATFTANDSTANVEEVEILGDGRIVVSGVFTSIGTTSTSAPGIAILQPDGAVDTTFSPALQNDAIRFAALPNNQFVIVDRFNTIRRLNSDGSVDTQWVAPTFSSSVAEITPAPNGSTLFAGQFTFIIGVSHSFVSRYTPAGVVDTTFMDGVVPPNNRTWTVKIDAHGRIYVGGDYTFFDGESTSRIVRLLGDGPELTIAAVTPNQNVTENDAITLEVVAAGQGTLSYQWYDGVSGDTSNPVNGATNPTYMTPPLATTGQFWVQVSEDNQTVDSATVTIGVVARPTISVTPDTVNLDEGAAPLDRAALLTGVTATDFEATDLTDDVQITGAVDTNTPGTYVITYDVQDAGGREALPQTRTYVIDDITAPELVVDPDELSIPVDIPVDVKIGVTATDNVDGMIPANDIIVGGDTVNVNVGGDYTVTYSVTDTAGNNSQASRLYHVVVDDVRPVVMVDPAIVNIDTGSPLVPAVLEGVTATDNLNGDITNQVLSHGQTPDPNTPGTYRVVYRVSDLSGNRSRPALRTYHVRNSAVNDTDEDQLDDQWERNHFGAGSQNDDLDLRWRGSDDADGDGDDNLTEFWADTDPLGYQIQLFPGWNLVSFYHVPTNNSISTLFVDDLDAPLYRGSPLRWDAETQQHVITDEIHPFSAVWLFARRSAVVTIELDAPGPSTGNGTEPDVDNDGLDDNWEIEHFGDLRFMGTDDPDGDGEDNQAEAIAETSPFGYEIELYDGWNLVSLPQAPTNALLATLFNGDIIRGRIWHPRRRGRQLTLRLQPTTGTWLRSNGDRVGDDAYEISLP